MWLMACKASRSFWFSVMVFTSSQPNELAALSGD